MSERVLTKARRPAATEANHPSSVPRVRLFRRANRSKRVGDNRCRKTPMPSRVTAENTRASRTQSVGNGGNTMNPRPAEALDEVVLTTGRPSIGTIQYSASDF